MRLKFAYTHTNRVKKSTQFSRLSSFVTVFFYGCLMPLLLILADSSSPSSLFSVPVIVWFGFRVFGSRCFVYVFICVRLLQHDVRRIVCFFLFRLDAMPFCLCHTATIRARHIDIYILCTNFVTPSDIDEKGKIERNRTRKTPSQNCFLSSDDTCQKINVNEKKTRKYPTCNP